MRITAACGLWPLNYEVGEEVSGHSAETGAKGKSPFMLRTNEPPALAFSHFHSDPPMMLN